MATEPTGMRRVLCCATSGSLLATQGSRSSFGLIARGGACAARRPALRLRLGLRDTTACPQAGVRRSAAGFPCAARCARYGCLLAARHVLLGRCPHRRPCHSGSGSMPLPGRALRGSRCALRFVTFVVGDAGLAEWLRACGARVQLLPRSMCSSASSLPLVAGFWVSGFCSRPVARHPSRGTRVLPWYVPASGRKVLWSSFPLHSCFWQPHGPKCSMWWEISCTSMPRTPAPLERAFDVRKSAYLTSPQWATSSGVFSCCSQRDSRSRAALLTARSRTSSMFRVVL